jgi:hypothetical protein
MMTEGREQTMNLAFLFNAYGFRFDKAHAMVVDILKPGPNTSGEDLSHSPVNHGRDGIAEGISHWLLSCEIAC